MTLYYLLIIKGVKLSKNSMKDFWDKNHKSIVVLLSLMALFTAVTKPIVWPSKIQTQIENLQKEDQRIKDAVNDKADKVRVEGDQALLKKDIDHLKEKVDEVNQMVKFLYHRSGGAPVPESRSNP